MNHEAIEVISNDDLKFRLNRLISLVKAEYPEIGGVMLFGRTNIYYFTGTFAPGILWIPIDNAPVLAVRKGISRAQLENPELNITTYKSFSDLTNLFKDMGSPLTDKIGIDKNSISWNLGDTLTSRLIAHSFIPIDNLIQRVRAVKTPLEISKIKKAGELHYEAVSILMPEWFSLLFKSKNKGLLSELDISRKLWDISLKLGHGGLSRMSNFGDETLLGHICTSDNTSYPSYYNGPLGVKGVHVTAAYMGNAQSYWKDNTILAIDSCFIFEGYSTDKTQLYFSGKRTALSKNVLAAQDCCMIIQQELAERLKPGAIPQELYKLSLEIAREHGFADNFMGVADNKVPFVGHGIGLNIDEWPVLANKFTDPLEENMVMAIEPKITILGFGMVGVENTFQVTKNGGSSLTNKTYNLADEDGNIIFI